METLKIEVYGIADKMICSGCEGHGCSTCSPGEKARTIDLFERFRELLGRSEFAPRSSAEFFEATPPNIARNEDVAKLLTMAELDPVIVLNGKVAYMGGFSPEGLLEELRKRKA